ncbi:MAG: glycosyltransferase family 4 protein [Coxiellaceae bacterium]|nr:glycosyltransferase family 4 protein [Coxiellaceae bacterium]
MKILIWVTRYFPYIGGIETVVHSLVQALCSMKQDVLVISQNVESDDTQVICIDGVIVHLIPYFFAIQKYDLKKINKNLEETHKIIEAFSPDIINIHGFYEHLAFYQVRILEKKQYPIVITLHGLLEQKSYQSTACFKLWAMAKNINTVSKALIEELNQKNITHKNTIRVIYNGIFLAPSVNVLIENTFNILAIGRLSQEKGFEFLFYAVKALLKKYPKIKLTLLGDGDQMNPLLLLKNTLQLNEAITMTGFLQNNQIAHYIDAAALIVMPSSYESFGLVAVEAANRFKPVIASNVGGLKEVIAHEETGILVKPSDANALANAIDYLLSDREKMQRMGIAAKKRAQDLFSLEKMTQAYLALYHEALQ